MNVLVVESPIGPLTLVVTDDALRAIHLPEQRHLHPTQRVDVVTDTSTHPVLERTASQLEEYFAGDRQQFDLPLAPTGTPFQLAAWQALTAIPYGVTVSYGEQARRLGDPNKARAVGAANARNPIPIVVPCHRVVGSSGGLTGFGGGLPTKAWLLEHEQRVAGIRLPF